jgi:transposase
VNEKSYSTGELAKYYDVSITAINKWINQGRFKNIERAEKNKQLRISENTLKG